MNKENRENSENTFVNVAKIISKISIVGVLFIVMVLIVIQIEKSEAEENKQIEAEEAAAWKRDEEIGKKQDELVSAYLKLPIEKIEVEHYIHLLDDEDSEYYVTAQGIEYNVRFDEKFTKIVKFVERPLNCSDQ